MSESNPYLLVGFDHKDMEYIESIIRKAYDYELDRKEKILGNLNAIVAAFAGLFIGNGVLIENMPRFEGEVSAWMWAFLVFSLISLIITLWHGWKLGSGGRYKYIRSPIDTLKEAEDIRKWIGSSNNSLQNIEIRNTMRENIVSEMACYAHSNYRVNNERLMIRLRLYGWMMFSSIMIAILYAMQMGYNSYFGGVCN